MKLINSVFLVFLGLGQIFAQTTVESKWQVEFSKGKSFIENVGQFDTHETATTGKIHYALDLGSTRIFFGEKGVCYNFLEIDKKSRDERAEIMNQPVKSFADHKQKERLAGKFLVKNDQVNMAWSNPNSSVQINGIGVAPDYHSYTFKNKNNEEQNINYVKGYDHIIYQNIYPNIDIKYEVHPVIGVKYAYIIHPGADPSQIKMLFDREIKLSNGEIIISTLFGDIIDHAPISFYEGDHNQIVNSKYSYTDNEVSFELDPYDQSKTIIIDPWVQTPVFPLNWDCVWELDTDAAGNVYIIGGVDPLQLKKYNSAGVLQWSYDTPYDTTEWLGTMATDDAGNSYVTNGTDYKILKVNTAGGLVWNNASPSGGTLSTEFWNISFNCDQTKLIVGGTGGTLDIHGRIYEVDMNSGNINSSVQVTQAGSVFSIPPQIQEVRGMSAAPNGKYYFVTLDTIGYLNDNLSLCPNGTTSLYMKNHSVNWGYKSENWRYNNTGIKVIRADANFVYINKGNALQKRSLADFSLIGSVTIPGGVLSTPFLSDNVTENAGIDIDNCGNIYVGSKTGVYKFNSSLVQQAFYPTSFFVYDVRVSTSGDIVACGGTGNSSSGTRSGGVQSFAASACIPIAITCCDASFCFPVDLCANSSPVQLTAATPGGTWSGVGVSATGVFTPSVAGVGTHLITYTLGCGSETISILVGSCSSLQVCEETNGNMTVTGGTGPYTWTCTVTTSTTSNDCTTCGGVPFFGSCIGATVPCTITSTSTVVLNGTTVTLPANTTSVSVADNGGTTLVFNPNSVLPCTTSCPTITVTTPSQTNVLCYGNTTGSATVSASGGTTNYTYTWSPGSLNGASQSNLAAGTYTVNVVDANSCPGSTTVTITQPASALSVSMASTPTNCGLSTGTATATPSGGTGSYGYSWSPSGGSGSVASNLASGPYVVTVTDGNSCQVTGNVSVAANGGPTISVSSFTNATCFNGTNGTATVSGSGGSGTLTYSWMPGSLTGATQNALAAGTYTVTVTDGGGCSNSTTVTIGQPTALSVSMASTPTNCGVSTGTATATASGGTGTLDYLWSPSGGTSSTASNLASGPYSVTITDDNNCQVVGNVSVSANGGPSIAVSSFTDVTCYNGTNGSATVSGSGGSGTLTYSWMPGSLTGATQNALSANTYTVTVTDGGGCSNSTTVTIGQPTAALSVTMSSTPTNCGASTGTATASATGGTGTYDYLWSPSGGSASTASNLASGPYSVTITDDNNCQVIGNVSVAANGGPSISVSSSNDVSCNAGNDGSATVSGSGGSGTLSYSWMPGSLTGTSQSSLAAGTYTVTVTDGACSNSTTVTINEPTAISLSSSNIISANCSASDGSATVNATGGTGTYIYAWSPTGGTSATASNIPGGLYNVVVTDQEGCSENLDITVPTIGGPTVTLQSSSDVTCFNGNDGTATVSATGGSGSYTYAWSPSGGSAATASNLTAGTYDVTVTDGSGCSNILTVNINQATAIAITETIIDANCGSTDGQISTSVTGGTGTYTYDWTPNGEITSSISNLSGGSYSVLVTDSDGCTATEIYTVQMIGTLPISVSPISTTIQAGESVQLNASGATTYTWTPSTGLSCTDCPDPIASPTTTTIYTVTGTDASGCVGTASLTIAVTMDCGEIYVPTVFAPSEGGASANNKLCVYGNCIAELNYAVYNRWGEKVFETTDPTICWDGKYKDKDLNSGVFAYKLLVTLVDGNYIEESGNVTLIR